MVLSDGMNVPSSKQSKAKPAKPPVTKPVDEVKSDFVEEPDDHTLL